MVEKSRELYIHNIRSIGESLIKNAESIVGDEKYLVGITINAKVCSEEEPVISIVRDFLPEGIIDEE